MITHPLSSRIRQGEDLGALHRRIRTERQFWWVIRAIIFVGAMGLAWILIGGAA